ncbi:MAG: lysylphosphatidylglycerol synthase transmembrane domain-containing protein [Desulfurococcaceae archaeon TW002]
MTINKALMITLLLAAASYILLFAFIYTNDVGKVFTLLMRSESFSYVSLALLTRIFSVTLHALTFFILLRAVEKVKLLDVIKVTYVSVFSELIVPVGGVTEVVKFTLLTKKSSVSASKTFLGITSHRLVTTLTMLTFLLLSIIWLHIPISSVLILILPAIALILINLSLFIVPRSKTLESLVNKFYRKIGKNVSVRIHEEYTNDFSSLVKRYDLVLIAILLSILERITNAAHGYVLALLVGLKLSFWQLVVGFDSIYMIMWLLPIVTPGNIGIYELTQTGVLNLVGISRSFAALLSILTRVFIMLGEYPLFLVAAVSFGISTKNITQLVREWSKSSSSY